VSWTVADPESAIGATSGCDPILINADTAGTILTCSATSAGGPASASVTIKRDVTSPTTSAGALPAANDNGWNNSDVTVSFEGTDATSGIQSCDAPTMRTGEGAAQTASGACTDNAGNVSAPATLVGINIDKTSPTLAPSISPSPLYVNSTATATANGSDALSGVATQTCESVDTTTVGTRSVSCTVTDNAGNQDSASVSYTVGFQFSGFFQPVDNLPIINRAKAGTAVPVKFSLNGNQGLVILAPGYPVSQSITCATGVPVDPIEETVSAGNSSLSYDAATGRYVYTWKTVNTWIGCRTLRLRFIDGKEQSAVFNIVK
jgi:hypothetical protein